MSCLVELEGLKLNQAVLTCSCPATQEVEECDFAKEESPGLCSYAHTRGDSVKMKGEMSRWSEHVPLQPANILTTSKLAMRF